MKILHSMKWILLIVFGFTTLAFAGEDTQLLAANHAASPAATLVKSPSPHANEKVGSNEQTVKPFIKPAGTALALYGPGDVYSMLVTGKESTNSLFQFEAVVPPGGGPPPHTHSREEETFYIISGSLEFQIGDVTHIANKGDFVYIPPGVVHRFKNVGDVTSVQLVTFSPSRMDGFFNEVFTVVKDRSVPPPPITQEFIKKMADAAPKYGLKYVETKK